jgi:hypothetical protein
MVLSALLLGRSDAARLPCQYLQFSCRLATASVLRVAGGTVISAHADTVQPLLPYTLPSALDGGQG